jgi:serine/threonine protein kinase/Tol biopolymer transport system component
MALAIGTRIGPYEITAPLGEGGMGVVFRARDTRLQRDVALKLLPDHLAFDSDRLKRFQREAQLLASLNHPHIAHVYGLEPIASSAAGASTLQAIAMELVEGDTLGERIESRGPIPVDEAVTIAKQIVAALEAAHERGIVHRDLKPANIKLTPDGTVKVLDFGLAKEVGTSGSTAALSHSPTVTGQSMPGVIMGTLGYMSPEQARGKNVDARADIWAFGCVVYEMLTGRRAFDGETATDIIAKIVSGEPDWTRLPKTTPAGLSQLPRVALKKDPRERLQHIGDSRLFLSPGVLTSETQAPREHHPNRHWWIVAAVASVVLVAALVPFALGLRGSPTIGPTMRFEIQVPGLQIVSDSMALSSDGRQIAYVASTDGTPRIRLRRIDETTTRVLPGTENAAGLFWAPDNRHLGFSADGKLKTVDVTGGLPQALADSTVTVRGAWNADDVILFTQGPILNEKGSSLGRVQASGGQVSTVAISQTDPPSISTVQPRFLPDGRHFLYHLVTRTGTAFSTALYAGSIDSGSGTRVMTLSDANAMATFASPGFLVYTKAGTLMAQRFDVDRLTVIGDPVSIAEQVGPFAVSDSGVLIYASVPRNTLAVSTPQRQFVWVNRSGQIERRIGLPSAFTNPRLSPDGHRIAVQSLDGNNPDIFVVDIASGIPSRLTFDPAADGAPIWSPQSDRVLFNSSRGSPVQTPSSLYERAASGTGEDIAVLPAKLNELNTPLDWSRDGRYIVYGSVEVTQLRSGGDLWALPLFGDRKPFPLVQSHPSRAGAARLSSDGRWLAYTTNESGMNRVVVRPFPEIKNGTWQVPGGAGSEPKWRGDGRELFYLTPDRTMMSVAVSAKDNQIQFGQPVALFKTRLPPVSGGIGQSLFDVSDDGQHFLLNLRAEDQTGPQTPAAQALTPQLTVVVNWPSLLTK